jgi:hypothetical protein
MALIAAFETTARTRIGRSVERISAFVLVRSCIGRLVTEAARLDLTFDVIRVVRWIPPTMKELRLLLLAYQAMQHSTPSLRRQRIVVE